MVKLKASHKYKANANNFKNILSRKLHLIRWRHHLNLICRRVPQSANSEDLHRSQFMQKKQKTADMRKRHPPYMVYTWKKIQIVYVHYGKKHLNFCSYTNKPWLCIRGGHGSWSVLISSGLQVCGWLLFAISFHLLYVSISFLRFVYTM